MSSAYWWPGYHKSSQKLAHRSSLTDILTGQIWLITLILFFVFMLADMCWYEMSFLYRNEVWGNIKWFNLGQVYLNTVKYPILPLSQEFDHHSWGIVAKNGSPPYIKCVYKTGRGCINIGWFYSLKYLLQPQKSSVGQALVTDKC